MDTPARRPCSARSEAALAAQAARLGEHLDTHPELEIRDVGHSLATTRMQFEHRACVIGNWREGLDDLARNGIHARVVTGSVGKSGDTKLAQYGEALLSVVVENG